MELQDLLDRAEITEALTRYTLAIDAGDFQDLDEVFTPDAQIDYSESGGTIGVFPDVQAWLAENLYAFAIRCMHTMGQVDIALAGDAANVQAYFHNPMVIPDGPRGAGGERVVEVGGIYHHTFTRTPDGWRSRRLREQVVWTRGF
ncbi:nuclear transport factor 2 family protein [Nocardioides nematodiphilus]|uniref:nuclear transport factor 2 family protein n=1 Tax=Nocardioides nematodiphilus TaxID=2849669 RepID=UPI001CD95BF1|nr:nuclear transport factor 2 family protein [Nocardioides nematodiphilus]MCA1982063.1 nuclear transport factor 2 family protein [Nocardioides nematodiphilus]